MRGSADLGVVRPVLSIGRAVQDDGDSAGLEAGALGGVLLAVGAAAVLVWALKLRTPLLERRVALVGHEADTSITPQNET